MNGAFDALEGLQVHLAIPDLWQQQAIRALHVGADVIVDAPTGAGKTYIFEKVVEAGQLVGKDRQAVFTVPTRALANDKWREWRTAGWETGIATGDLAENLDAPVLVATLETQRERLLAGQGPRLLVVDEYQMLGDSRRGLNYELALALAPAGTQLLLLSGSVANAGDVAAWLRNLGRTVEVVQTHHRPVPLDEIPLGALPDRAPRKVKNFWQRLALGVLLSDLGPLLIFAPQRRAAERIARKIAEALPDDDPIELTAQDLRHAAGHDLARMLRKRIAWHHSGLSYAQRAAIVEPLAKAGQLRVIVATMGLAAGINFSVRSVFVGDTLYQDGPFQKEVRPDELLQMFGRAGRRGLDETGYVIATDTSPRLMDARPLNLKRSNEVDWPTLLRVMKRAVDQDRSPIEAARDLSRRLFSRQRIVIGFGGIAETKTLEKEPAATAPEGLFGLKPTRNEVLNSAGAWETYSAAGETAAPLAEALIFAKGNWIPALSSPAYISGKLPKNARLSRFEPAPEQPKRYGGEIAAATASGEADFSLTRLLRILTGLSKKKSRLPRPEAEARSKMVLEEYFAGARIAGFVLRGSTLTARADFSGSTVAAYRDSLGKNLIAPQRRTVVIEAETHFVDESTGIQRETRGGTAAHAWRKLGLIDDRGAPTRRGLLFSFFQHGEGLAVAAGLEDEHYPIDALIWHLINLRASHRFEIAGAGTEGDSGSERLAMVCRRAYGPVDHEGYLRLGLPVGYGEGAAEAVQAWQRGGPGGQKFGPGSEFGIGDIERACIEWLSLLRHIRGAPDFDFDRWRELKAVAGELLDRKKSANPLRNLPEFPSAVLSRRRQHRLTYRQVQGLGH